MIKEVDGVGYLEAKRELTAWTARRDAIELERRALRTNRELARIERDYIYAQMTAQIVDILIECRRFAGIVFQFERRGVPNPFNGYGYSR